MMKVPEFNTCVSIRLIPNVAALNGTDVKTGGGVPCASPKVHIPITGSVFDSLEAPVSSNAVTATERVRFACAAI